MENCVCIYLAILQGKTVHTCTCKQYLVFMQINYLSSIVAYHVISTWLSLSFDIHYDFVT